MAGLLLELFSEEIPARMQARAADDFKKAVVDRLKEARLDVGDAVSYVTPRRLVLMVDGLPVRQPDIKVERKGPKVGAPDQAVEGFLKSVGLTLEQCEQRDTPKGAVWFAVSEEAGRETAAVLGDLLSDALTAIFWAKSMRWGQHALRWVRPLHAILCQFDGAVVPFEFGHLRAGNITHGHRFMAPDSFQVADADDYRSKLLAAKVMLDPEDRKAAIWTGALALAEAEGLVLEDDPALLAENAGLNEWPIPLVGRFDDAFLAVPEEALVSAMRKHQKYFALRDAAGKLAPRFVLVSNIETTDAGAAIVAGNERVLRARLSDARFFWDQDLKAGLEAGLPALSGMVFHAKLGSLGDKVRRIAALSADLSKFVPGANGVRAIRAAKLAKADLVTAMVGEFPDLQGIMGAYYARHAGEDEAVARAISEHYRPQGPGDACPSAPESVTVALADKIDTLVGFFAIDEKPTGSKDPFALRRAALGVIRLVLENNLRLPLTSMITLSYKHWGQTPASKAFIRNNAPLAADLVGFLVDRLKNHLRDKGLSHDIVDACITRLEDAQERQDDLLQIVAKAEALKDFIRSEDGSNLLIAYRRANNIVKIESKKDGQKGFYLGGVDQSIFQTDEESSLLTSIDGVKSVIDEALKTNSFAVALAHLAKIRPAVDAFFDHVTVNADDPAIRKNRLRLLSEIPMRMDQIADFSQIEG